MMRRITQAALFVALLNPLNAETIFGGDQTTDVSNWITSSVAFDDTVQSGHSFNWENVITNTATIDGAGGKFDLTWEAGADYTVGHLFMYDAALDLATLANGIERFYWVANFESTMFPNWSPVISVTTGGVTRYYRWNHSANDWSGNGPLNFSAPFNGEDPYRFDLSQLGNGTSGATGIWGELNATSSNFAGTRDNPTGPDLQAATGEVRFGFLQWSQSDAEALEVQSFSTVIDCFEVIINADPGVAPVVEDVAVAEVTAVSAEVSGDLTTFGTDFSDLTVYWGETDGGTDPGAWGSSEFLGVEACDFSIVIAGLTRNTTYFYRFFAENGAGSDWSDASGTFTTLSASEPAVIVTAGSSSSPGTGNFTGEVTDTGNENPVITLFYGTSDAGTSAGGWDANLDLGAQGGSFTEVVTDLEGATTYFYRVFAENSAGAAWSPTTESLTTLDFEGVPNTLGFADFDLRYEMDVNPSSQDLDMAG
ncbi:fibronectin type III domain-containing protein, partial [bacterium]|nr:fibronectin type III domain-containing protein [bacterium]